MLTRTVSVPELAFIAGTRMALGAGIGLLLADHVKPEQRRAVGWTLLAVGLLTTIPLAADVLFRHPNSKNGNQDENASEHPGDMVSAHDTL